MQGWIESDDAGGLRVVGMVKEDDLHPCSIGGKDTEVCSCGSYGRAERIGIAGACPLSRRIEKPGGGLMRFAHQRCHSICEASRGTEAFS